MANGNIYNKLTKVVNQQTLEIVTAIEAFPEQPWPINQDFIWDNGFALPVAPMITDQQTLVAISPPVLDAINKCAYLWAIA